MVPGLQLGLETIDQLLLNFRPAGGELRGLDGCCLVRLGRGELSSLFGRAGIEIGGGASQRFMLGLECLLRLGSGVLQRLSPFRRAVPEAGWPAATVRPVPAARRPASG